MAARGHPTIGARFGAFYALLCALVARANERPAIPDDDKFPPGVPYSVGNELAERFSFYGFKTILKQYLTALLLNFVNEAMLPASVVADAMVKSTEYVHLFNAAVYSFPLIGAQIADRYLGKYRTIYYVSIGYVIGHAILGVATHFGTIHLYEAAKISFGLGLGLIAVSAGGIKPCASSNLGDQFPPLSKLILIAFSLFYFAINYGSLGATILTPIMLDKFGPEVAFGLPGIAMAIATIVFRIGEKKFIKAPPTPGGKLGLLDSLVTTLLLSPLFATVIGYFVLWQKDAEIAEKAFNKANEVAIRAAEALGQTPPEFHITWSFVQNYLTSHWWLFALTAAAITLGSIIFIVRQRRQPDNTSFLPILIWSLKNRHLRKQGDDFFDPARNKFGKEAGDGPPAVLRIMVVFGMVAVFWALFDQHSSTWVDQAKMMALHLIVPAWLGYWTLATFTIIILYVGIGLFCRLANRPPKRLTTYTILGLLAFSGFLSGGLDLFGPPIGNRVIPVIVKTDTPTNLNEANTVIKKKLREEVNVSVIVVRSSVYNPKKEKTTLTTADFRRATPLDALIATIGLPDAMTPANLAEAARLGVELKNYSSVSAFQADIEARRTVKLKEQRPHTLTLMISPSQPQAANPLFVMIIIPLLTLILGFIATRYGIVIRPLYIMAVGMFLTAFSFVIAALVQRHVQESGEGVVHVLWQLPQYFSMTVAEVMVSITGLAFAYTQAPRAMKATVTGFFNFTVALGNLIVAFLAPLEKLSLAYFFWVFAGIQGFAAIIFAILVYYYVRRLKTDERKAEKATLSATPFIIDTIQALEGEKKLP